MQIELERTAFPTPSDDDLEAMTPLPPRPHKSLWPTLLTSFIILAPFALLTVLSLFPNGSGGSSPPRESIVESIVMPQVIRFRDYLSPADPAKGWYYMICIGAFLLVLAMIMG